MLAEELQSFAGGGQDLHPRSATQDLSQQSSAVKHLLRAVHYQEKLFGLQVVEELVFASLEGKIESVDPCVIGTGASELYVYAIRRVRTASSGFVTPGKQLTKISGLGKIRQAVVVRPSGTTTIDEYLPEGGFNLYGAYNDIALFLAQDETNKMGYVDNERDCDDFSYRLMGQFSIPGWSHVCLGIVWTGTHALNCFVDEDSRLMFIEPQSDEIMESLPYGDSAWIIVI